jgi:hypothetical protein
VAVEQGQNLPLASVLVPQPTELALNDPFKTWAMSRSQAVSSDNATAAGILDDPTQSGDAGFSGYAGIPGYAGVPGYVGVPGYAGLPAAGGGFTYFPPSVIPGLSSPYGVSFWSPFQAGLSSMYFPTYLYGMYGYGSLFPAWPGAVRMPIIVSPSRILVPSRTYGAPGSLILPRSPSTIGVPRTVAPHVGVGHVGARR